MAQSGKELGDVVVSLRDLVGDPAQGADDVTFQANLLVLKATEKRLSGLGGQVYVEGPKALVDSAAVVGLTDYTQAPAGRKRIVMATRQTIESRGLRSGEGAYVIAPQEAGTMRNLQGELFVSAALSAVRISQDAVDEKVIRFIARAKGLYNARDLAEIGSILHRLALGAADWGRAFLEHAEKFVALPPVAKIGIGRILQKTKELLAQMAVWA